MVRAGCGLEYRQRRKAETPVALGDELHLSRRSVEREIRICDMRDLQRADPTLGGEGGRGRVTGGGMVEQRIERARLFGPGKEIAHLETPGQFAQHPGRRPRLAWRVEHLRHQIEMGVRALAAGSLEP